MADTQDKGEGSKAPKKDAKEESAKQGEGSEAPKKDPKKPAAKKGKKAKKAGEEGQESEGEGDVVASDEEEESLGEEFSGEEEEYDSDVGLLDFVVRDSDVEEEGEEEEEIAEPADGTLRPLAGIEMEPAEDPKNDGFNIVRLIQYTNKGGADEKCPINIKATYFTVQYGDFLLDLSDLTEVDRVHVRNYYGQERFIPRRMLQSIRLPWGLPAKIQLDDNGIGLPVAFINEPIPAAFGGINFDEDEVVMVKVAGDPSTVIDFERRTGKIKMPAPKIKPLVSKKGKEPKQEEEEDDEFLWGPCAFPWDLRVDPDWVDHFIMGKVPGKKGDGKGKQKDSGEGPSKRGPKRKRDKDSDDEDEQQPKPRPKKRAILTPVAKKDVESAKQGPFSTLAVTKPAAVQQSKDSELRKSLEFERDLLKWQAIIEEQTSNTCLIGQEGRSDTLPSTTGPFDIPPSSRGWLDDTLPIARSPLNTLPATKAVVSKPTPKGQGKGKKGGPSKAPAATKAKVSKPAPKGTEKQEPSDTLPMISTAAENGGLDGQQRILNTLLITRGPSNTLAIAREPVDTPAITKAAGTTTVQQNKEQQVPSSTPAGTKATFRKPIQKKKQGPSSTEAVTKPAAGKAKILNSNGEKISIVKNRKKFFEALQARKAAGSKKSRGRQ